MVIKRIITWENYMQGVMALQKISTLIGYIKCMASNIKLEHTGTEMVEAAT